MRRILISGAKVINEGCIEVADVLIEAGFISQVGPHISAGNCKVIDGRGKYLLPGIIDTHVHFREPGLTYKGDILSESAAAVAGGVTTFFDMPNTLPNAISLKALKEKYDLAEKGSYANFAFYLGATEDALQEITSYPYIDFCGLTDDGLYMTSSASLLVEQPNLLRTLLNRSDKIVSIHSEYEESVKENIKIYREKFGINIPVCYHSVIRGEEGCYLATKAAIEIASQTRGRLHILHLSTAKETELFEANPHIQSKRVTSEVCVHHLWFSDQDYSTLGNRIKWNPSIKTLADRDALINAINQDRIDIVSTDHAPHLLSEKSNFYEKAPSGAPMIQHSLLLMLELVKMGRFTIQKIVEKMCHNPALLFGIEKRGFIRCGYHADLVLVDMNKEFVVTKGHILYKSGWSPIEGEILTSKVICTIVNGTIAYSNDVVCKVPRGIKVDFVCE